MKTESELREVYRVLPTGAEERVRMQEIRAGERFRIQVDDPADELHTMSRRVFEAIKDARLIDGVWGVAVQWT